MRRLVWIVGCLLLLSCCASQERVHQAPVLNSSDLDYSALVLEFIDATSTTTLIQNKDSMDGAKEGAEMMLRAPVECMRGGMLYGFCLMLAPIFPLLSAHWVQDPVQSQHELEVVAERLHSLGLFQHLQNNMNQQILTAGLPLVASPQMQEKNLRLRVTFGPVQMLHDGYRNGGVTITVNSQFELFDHHETRVAFLQSQRSGYFGKENWQVNADFDDRLTGWVRQIGKDATSRLLTEWQPRLVLAPVMPALARKRNVIGIVQDYWDFVDSVEPELIWQPLEQVMAPKTLDEVTDIRYELKLLGAGGAQVYHADNLPLPSHQIAVELIPCAYYHWLPVAHFRYRGMMFTTSLRTRQWDKEIVLDDFYLLKTPGPDCKEPHWSRQTVQ